MSHTVVSILQTLVQKLNRYLKATQAPLQLSSSPLQKNNINNRPIGPQTSRRANRPVRHQAPHRANCPVTKRPIECLKDALDKSLKSSN